MPGMMSLPRDWQCPSREAADSYKLGWIDENTEQGAAWIESQRGYQEDWKQGLDIISGKDSPTQSQSYLNRLSGNRLKTNIRTIVAGLSNVRPLWGYHASKSYASFAEVLNKTAYALYLEGSWDQAIKEALAYASVCCTGWIRPLYRRDMRGVGNIELDTYGMPCILPVQIPANGNYQRAYTVTLLEEVPVYDAHWRFPLWQDQLKPTASRYWYAAEIRTAAKQNAMRRLLNLFKISKQSEVDKLVEQYIPIRWTWINDCRINETGHTVTMGEQGSSWYYEVPSYGSEILDGYEDGSTDEMEWSIDGFKPKRKPVYRKANENDARLYPNRRLMISSEKCLMYDGPGFDWHADVPLIPFTMDKWPWEPIGFGLVRDGWEIQKTIDQIDGGCRAKIRAQLDPALAYPMGAVDKTTAEDFDPMEERTRVGYDEQAVDDAFKLAVPLDVYRLWPEVAAYRQTMVEELDYTTQTRDVVELSKAKALGKNFDSIEALISAQGPIVKDIARSMEWSLTGLGRQVGFLILQYMTTGRLMQWVDPNDLSTSVFDYNPGTLIPSHMPDENPHDAEEKPVASKYTTMERAKNFIKNIRFFLLPNSVHQLEQMTKRLMLMQLKKAGAPISWGTTMKSCEVPNVAEPEGNSEQEKWQNEEEQRLEFAARMAKITQAITQDQGIQPTPPAPQGKKKGRPPSNQQSPHVDVKGDGRQTVSTSP